MENDKVTLETVLETTKELQRKNLKTEFAGFEKTSEPAVPEKFVHVKIDKIIRFCSECPYSYISHVGYGKRGCYESEISCTEKGISYNIIVHSGLLWKEIYSNEKCSNALDRIPETCPLLNTGNNNAI